MGRGRAWAHPQEWQSPWRWATEGGTIGRIQPTIKKDNFAQGTAVMFTKKKPIKRGRSQFAPCRVHMRATWIQNPCKNTCSSQKSNLCINNRGTALSKNIYFEGDQQSGSFLPCFSIFFFVYLLIFNSLHHLTARRRHSATECTSITKSGPAKAIYSTQLRGQQACSQSPEMTWLQKTQTDNSRVQSLEVIL